MKKKGAEKKKVGAAERAQKRWRDRKKKIFIDLDKEAVGMLNMMICQPERLVVEQNVTHKPYIPKDAAGGKQLIDLQEWVQNKGVQGGKTKRLKGYIAGTYHERIKDILTHYEALGRSPWFAKSYWTLHEAIEGKEFESHEDEVFEFDEGAPDDDPDEHTDVEDQDEDEEAEDEEEEDEDGEEEEEEQEAPAEVEPAHAD